MVFIPTVTSASTCVTSSAVTSSTGRLPFTTSDAIRVLCRQRDEALTHAREELVVLELEAISALPRRDAPAPCRSPSATGTSMSSVRSGLQIALHVAIAGSG